jgi:hypothetical protein
MDNIEENGRKRKMKLSQFIECLEINRFRENQKPSMHMLNSYNYC